MVAGDKLSSHLVLEAVMTLALLIFDDFLTSQKLFKASTYTAKLRSTCKHTCVHDYVDFNVYMVGLLLTCKDNHVHNCVDYTVYMVGLLLT